MFKALFHLGGLFNGSKRLLGVVTVAYTAVQMFAPQYMTLANEILQMTGLALLPIGVVDAANKKK